ncbi:MAG TPA: GNAT family N-acetyltransferase [Hymenobacter sp.]|jgi:ribosomal-protein-alanine N-acetyltransferase|uniref:GNAT family N-acetyltransferase n=1 Tax=Hymenobacter sp. TaxID=1898978 RepID=UPI002EDA8916
MNLPPYPSFPVLSSGVVTLRQVLPADSNSLFEISFYDARPAQNLTEAAEMQEKINADYQRGTSIHWAIVSAATAEVAGTVGYYRGFENGTGELGCVLKPAFRGQGLMREAMKLAIKFGLTEMQLTEILAVTTKQNVPANNLLEKLGFRKTVYLPDGELVYRYS